MYDTYLIDGTDIYIPGVQFVEDLGGLDNVSPLRGGQLVYPGRDGEVSVDRNFDTGTLTLAIGLLADTSAELNDLRRALRRLFRPGHTVTLTRRQAFSSGNEDHTAAAEFLSLEEKRDLDGLGSTVVASFKLLDGLWFGAFHVIGSGVVDVLGDVRTHRMTIALSGATTPQVITNTLTGHRVTYSGPTGVGVVIYPEAMTAFKAGVDMSRYLSWNKSMPFRLEPGVQTITDSGPDPVISYAPAFL